MSVQDFYYSLANDKHVFDHRSLTEARQVWSQSLDTFFSLLVEIRLLVTLLVEKLSIPTLLI